LTEELPAIKVLLIEDNPDDVANINNSLTNRTFAKFEVDVAGNPHDGLGRLDESAYDVVLLDAVLSGSDSLEILSKIRERADVPIVVLTRTDDKASALEAIRRGAQDYLVKGRPSDESLCRVLCYAVERRRFQKLVSETQRDAKEVRSNLEFALRASNVATWHCDIASDKLTWSQEAQRLFGLRPDLEYLTFKEFLAIVHPDDRESTKQAVKDSIKSTDIYDVEYRIILSDGSIRNFVSKGRTFFDESGKAVRMAGICADITKHKMEEENAQRLALLEEREDFTATLTHDLKNPLIGIRRVAEIMSEQRLGPLSQDQGNALLQIRNTSDRLLFMIHNLIEAYRFDKDSQTITMQPTDLVNLLQSSIDAVVPIATDRQIVISLQLPAFPVEVKVDTGAIHRLFQNLLDNAVKYTATGGNILVSVSTQGSSVVVEVSDNGVGISADDQKHLFERFRRGTAGKKVKSGNGLGLYLCKQIVDAHSGQIDVTSTEGIGTKFKVTLPLHSKQAAVGIRQRV
jgi:PAS domain S-box-containing protein